MGFDEDSTMIRERYLTNRQGNDISLVLLLRSCLLSYWYWLGGRWPGWPVFILRGFALIYLTVVTSPSPSRFDLVHISWDGLVTTYVHAEGPTLSSLLCNKSVILIGGLSQHLWEAQSLCNFSRISQSNNPHSLHGDSNCTYIATPGPPPFQSRWSCFVFIHSWYFCPTSLQLPSNSV